MTEKKTRPDDSVSCRRHLIQSQLLRHLCQHRCHWAPSTSTRHPNAVCHLTFNFKRPMCLQHVQSAVSLIHKWILEFTRYRKFYFYFRTVSMHTQHQTPSCVIVRAPNATAPNDSIFTCLTFTYFSFLVPRESFWCESEEKWSLKWCKWRHGADTLSGLFSSPDIVNVVFVVYLSYLFIIVRLLNISPIFHFFFLSFA